jgi:hypothetical protein
MINNKRIILLTLVLAIVAVVLVLNRSKGTFSKELKDFAVDDTTNITRIFMVDKSNHSVDLKKTNPGNWKANDDFIVRNDAINLLLKTMLNIDVMEPVQKAGHNSVIKSLASNSVKIEVYQQKYRINLFNKLKLFPHEKRTKVYYVGSNTQDNIGTYMLMEGSSVPFIVYLPGFKGFVSVRYSSRLEDWRDHTVFNHKIVDIKSIKIEFLETPPFSVEVSNNNDRSFTLKSLYTGQEINDYDTTKMLDFLASFYSIKYEALLLDLPKPKQDSITKSKPFHIITLTEKSGKTLVVKTFHRANPGGPIDENGNMVIWDRDRMYALVNNDKDFVIIQFFVFDNLLKPLEYFLKAPPMMPTKGGKR